MELQEVNHLTLTTLIYRQKPLKEQHKEFKIRNYQAGFARLIFLFLLFKKTIFCKIMLFIKNIFVFLQSELSRKREERKNLFLTLPSAAENHVSKY